MHSVHLCKPKECTVVLPGIRQDFFIPVIGHSKVSILVVCLPRITRQGDEAGLVVLQINSAVFYPNLNITIGTLIRFRRWVRFFLNSLMIYARVAFPVGTTTPQVEQAATAIISLKAGYLRACMGFMCVFVGTDIWARQKAHLVGFNQPSDGCISKKVIGVWYDLLLAEVR